MDSVVSTRARAKLVDSDEDKPKAEPSGQRRSAVLSDSLIIAVATAEAYGIAFSHEWGYLYRFNIPGHLIRLSATHIALSLIACLLAILAVINVINMTSPVLSIILSKKYQQWEALIKVNCFLLLILLVALVLYPLKDFPWLPVCGVFLFLNFIYFALPITLNIFSRKYPTDHDAIKASLSEPLQFQLWLKSKGAFPYFVCIYLLSLPLLFAWAVGNSTAIKQRSFDTYQVYEMGKGSEILLVLRSYDQQLICKPVDLASKTYGSGYRLISLGEQIAEINNLEIGELTLGKSIH